MEETAARRGSSGHVVAWVLLGQVGSGVLLGAVLWGVYGSVAGYSALLGGLICVVPNAFLALRLTVPRRDQGARSLIRAAYIGEIGKVMLTVLLFSIVFLTVRPLAAGPLFAGFIVAQLMTFIGLVPRKERQRKGTTGNTNGE